MFISFSAHNNEPQALLQLYYWFTAGDIDGDCSYYLCLVLARTFNVDDDYSKKRLDIVSIVPLQNRLDNSHHYGSSTTNNSSVGIFPPPYLAAYNSSTPVTTTTKTHHGFVRTVVTVVHDVHYHGFILYCSICVGRRLCRFGVIHRPV
jgi:hypothetical protein